MDSRKILFLWITMWHAIDKIRNENLTIHILRNIDTCYINQVFNSILWNIIQPNYFFIYTSCQCGTDHTVQCRITIYKKAYHSVMKVLTIIYSSSRRRSTEWVFSSWTEEESHSHCKDPKHETEKHYLCFMIYHCKQSSVIP